MIWTSKAGEVKVYQPLFIYEYPVFDFPAQPEAGLTIATLSFLLL